MPCYVKPCHAVAIANANAIVTPSGMPLRGCPLGDARVSLGGCRLAHLDAWVSLGGCRLAHLVGGSCLAVLASRAYCPLMAPLWVASGTAASTCTTRAPARREPRSGAARKPHAARKPASSGRRACSAGARSWPVLRPFARSLSGENILPYILQCDSATSYFACAVSDSVCGLGSERWIPPCAARPCRAIASVLVEIRYAMYSHALVPHTGWVATYPSLSLS